MRIGFFSKTLRSKTARCKLFLLLLFCLIFSGESSAQEVISLKAYHQRILKSIQYLESQQGKLTQNEIVSLEKGFPKGLRIEYGEKDQVLLDYHGMHEWIQKAQKNEEGKKQLIVHLKSLLSQTLIEKEPLPRTLTWAESQNRLNDVFSEKEFRYLDDKTRSNWLVYLTKILEYIGKWLRSHILPARWIRGKWIEYLTYGIYFVVLVFGSLLVLRIFRSSGPVGWRWKEPRLRMNPEKKAISTPYFSVFRIKRAV